MKTLMMYKGYIIKKKAKDKYKHWHVYMFVAKKHYFLMTLGTRQEAYSFINMRKECLT